MSARISASLSPLQSRRSAILLSIRLDALIWSDDAAAALRGLAAFTATRLAAAFFATFAGFFAVFYFAAAFFVVLPAILVHLRAAVTTGSRLPTNAARCSPVSVDR